MNSSPAAGAIAVFDIDGVIRDVSGSYRRALADTVERFTEGAYRPTPEDIDALKGEGQWNNDWEGSRELVYRYFEGQGRSRGEVAIDYDRLVAFFQSRYRGDDPERWTGYICNEPLLVALEYFENLSAAGVRWGFFSGATAASAGYVLKTRLGLNHPVLIAMEDAPGKPDPTGLIATVVRLAPPFPEGEPRTILYAGDTVADMHTVTRAARSHPQHRWLGIGILPPHVRQRPDGGASYSQQLQAAGACEVLPAVAELTPERIAGAILL